MAEAFGIRPSSYTQADADELNHKMVEFDNQRALSLYERIEQVAQEKDISVMDVTLADVLISLEEATKLLEAISLNRLFSNMQVIRLARDLGKEGEWAGLGGPFSRIDHHSQRWIGCNCWLCTNSSLALSDPGTED